MMGKKELFEKYEINESHSKKDMKDNWNDVEIYREMHNGELPKPDDLSCAYVLDWLDKPENKTPEKSELRESAKRYVYEMWAYILNELENGVMVEFKILGGNNG